MKKNITINLFGTLYNIDEDAYQLLDNYLQSMKRYFGTRDGGEEIADDIEHRVAELLWEKKEQGIDAISIEIIKEIIGKIGNAEEIAGEQQAENDERKTENGEQNAESDNTCTETDDFNGMDASQVKTYLKGVKAYYVLNTPEEYSIATKVAPNYIAGDYGVEEFIGGNVPFNSNILFYMRSLVNETRNFLDRLMDGLGSDITAVADKIVVAVKQHYDTEDAGVVDEDGLVEY